MREAVTISRQAVKENDERFAALKAHGVQLAQQISGNSWSDYNAHDPGITILEQLCYAITELTFHADFDVADLLLNDEGLIDYQAQSLHLPEEVFPCRPTTAVDLRKMLLDEVKEIDNVWLSIENVTGDTESDGYGLYRAAVRRNGSSGLDDEALLGKIFNAFNRHRNLCEDLGQVTILEDRSCILHAQVEVDSSQHVDELLAEIYFNCSEYVSGNIPLKSYDKALAEGSSLEQLFDGPLTQHGLFDLQHDGMVFDEILVPTLFSIINEICGVVHIKELSLEVDGERFYEAYARGDGERVLSLNFPCNAASVTIELFRNGGVLPVSIDVVRKCYQEMGYRKNSMREVAQNFAALYSLPQGKVRGLGHYTSIQEHFPVIYGINRYGASGESLARVAQTRQLKSYLLLFEQLMANFSATCARLDKLYSTDNSQRQTYGYCVIDEQTISGIDLLYPERPAEAIARILSGYDNYFERKGRVLDCLLALYGQKFTQNTLRYFNYYYQGEELDEIIVKNKIACLESIIKFDRDRAAGIDLSQITWNSGNVSGLQYKLSILLGFRHTECRSLTLPLAKLGLKVICHDDYRMGSYELKMIDLSDIKEHVIDKFYPLTYEWCDEEQAVMEVGDNLELFVPLKNNVISDSLLQDGVALDRFRIGSLAPDNDYQMVFRSTTEQEWWYLGRTETREVARRSILLLNRFLIHLNIESEGLHCLEHLLLRPQHGQYHCDLAMVDQAMFYRLRITVIFPSWTARCNDSRFRILAEESVRANCPAHIFADIYWFDFDTMYRFETLYKCWLELRTEDNLSSNGFQNRAQSGAGHEIDEAAKALILFLHQQQRGSDE